MPDNGILGGLSSLLGGLSGALAPMNPQAYEGALRARAYNALAPQYGQGGAALAMSQPALQQQLFQQQLFQAQVDDFIRTHPGTGLNQAIYGTSPEGLKGQYGVNFGPPVKAGSVEAPITYGQGQPPHLFNVGPPSPQQEQPSQQTQPTQQPASAIDNLTNVAADTERKLAAAKSKGEEEGSAQTTVQGSVDQINRSISLIDELVNHPGMKWATGLLGSVPPLPGTQAYAFVKGLDQLKDQLTLDILPSLQRKGSRISPALVELLQKSTAGQELDRSSPDMLKNLQATRAALMQIRGATQTMANVPTTQENFEGRTVTNKKTGQKGIIQNGQLVPRP